MSNPFKSNEHRNTFTRDRNNAREYSIIKYNKTRDAELQEKRDIAALEKQRAYEDALDAKNYPALNPEGNVAVKSNNMNYLSQIQKEESCTQIIDPDVENLLPGWTLMRKHPTHGFQIYKNVNVSTNNNINDNIQNVVFDALSDLHEERTNEFIDKFGYDVWEEMFKYPRWIEDQAYLEEMDNLYISSSSDDEGDEDES